MAAFGSSTHANN